MEKAEKAWIRQFLFSTIISCALVDFIIRNYISDKANSKGLLTGKRDMSASADILGFSMG